MAACRDPAPDPASTVATVERASSSRRRPVVRRADQRHPRPLQPDPDPAARRVDHPVRLVSPRTAWQFRPVLEQYGFFILIVLSSSPVLAASVSDRRCRSDASWWAHKTRQFGAPLRARVSDAERRPSTPGSTRPSSRLFDAMHVADRRHGLDVVAHLRGGRPRRITTCSGGPAPRLRGKGHTGVWPGSPSRWASAYGPWVWRRRRRRPGLGGRAGAAARSRRAHRPSSRPAPVAATPRSS